MKVEKYGRRFWAVYDVDGTLICVTVYKRGAKEVVRRRVLLPEARDAARNAFRRWTIKVRRAVPAESQHPAD
jgi:hypothetical protein